MKNLKLIIAIAAIAIAIITNISAMEQRPSGMMEDWTGMMEDWMAEYSATLDPEGYAREQASKQTEEQGEEQEKEKRLRELQQLEQRREMEKMKMKPATKIFGISVLNQLMEQKSDEARNATLNTLPTEIKESLISVIDDRRQLLDRNQPDQAALVEDLNMLQKQIQQNLSQ